MSYLPNDDDWQGPTEKKRSAVQELLTALSGRAPLDVVIQSYLKSVANYDAATVEAACNRLLETATERPYPARLRNHCRQIRGDREDEAKRHALPPAPPGERWLTPEECRTHLEALQAHPEPEGYIQGTVHRIMLLAYARGADR